MPGRRSGCTGTCSAMRRSPAGSRSGGRARGVPRSGPSLPAIDPAEATRELARRYLHVFGPASAAAFGTWAAVSTRKAARAFNELGGELIPVGTPAADALMLARDEATIREAPLPAAAARLLPSGDAYTLGITSEDRALLVPDDVRRRELWTPRVWPGALLVAGKIAGTWRRAGGTVRIQAWQRLSRAAREAVLAEAESLPLPATGERIVVHWD